jgi:hypothetical protein
MITGYMSGVRFPVGTELSSSYHNKPARVYSSEKCNWCLGTKRLETKANPSFNKLPKLSMRGTRRSYLSYMLRCLDTSGTCSGRLAK